LPGARWLLVCCAAISCSGRAASSPPAPPDGDACGGQQLLIVNCSGCHDGSPEDSGGLDLGAPNLVARLLGKPASGSKCATLGAVLIDSQGGGLLLDKLATPPPCGDRMPQGTRAFSADETSCLATFLSASLAAAPEQPRP
jgi:hypothetical protein